LALIINSFNPLNWRYERLKDGTHWYYPGQANDEWKLGDKLQCTLTTPPLFRAIDIIADKLAQVEFLIDGEPVEDHPLVKVLNNPNPFQSKQDFIKEFTFFKYSYGWVYQYPVIPTGFNINSLAHIYNLNPSKVCYNKDFATRLMFEADYQKAKEKQFKYEEDEQDREFNIGDVIAFFDVANGLSKDFLLKAPSRLDSIAAQISNIKKSGQAKHSAIRKAGRKVVSGENTGAMMNKGLTGGEKEDIERKLNLHGLANEKNDIIVTTAKSLTIDDLSVKLKDLGLDESFLSDAQVIMNHFGIPRELYQVDKSGSTYENQKEAYINLVQSVVQIEANDMINTYKSYFGIEDEITPSFQHLPEMQHVENLKADKMLKISAAIRNITGSGLTPEDLFEMAGIEKPEG
jgi:hypothetical protein